jgi:hypothetical protein
VDILHPRRGNEGGAIVAVLQRVFFERMVASREDFVKSVPDFLKPDPDFKKHVPDFRKSD